MKNKLILFSLSLLLAGTGVSGECLSKSGEIQYKEEIAPYVSFLKNQSQKPVDYVMGLFDKYDMVILCERFHPEATQYEFIYDLVSDKRFIDKIGNVFVEIGTSTMNGYLHDFLFADGLNERQVEDRLLHIYRNFSFQVIWEKYDLYDFFKRLYSLNESLPTSRKINLYFSDMPFSWEGMTKEKYKQFHDGLDKRDWVMADQVIKKFADISQTAQPRKKALVIMNYRHAFNDNFKYESGEKTDNTGRYIFEAFPGKVANVMINSVDLLPGSNDQESIITPISNGKWDAAFEIVGNLDLGFNLQGNPFGADYFDYFPFFKHGYKYQDVFTGFIFYKPLKEHKFLWGTPKLFADGYEKIIPERMVKAEYPISPNKITDFMKRKETLVENTYGNLSDMMKINQWLLPTENK
jgi:hypothetical protein